MVRVRYILQKAFSNSIVAYICYFYLNTLNWSIRLYELSYYVVVHQIMMGTYENTINLQRGINSSIYMSWVCKDGLAVTPRCGS